MPKVALTNEQKVNKRIKELTEDTRKQLYAKRITQKAVADAAGIEQCSVANQFRRGQLTLSVYLAAQLLLEEQ